MSLPFVIVFVIILQFLIGLLYFVIRDEYIKKLFAKQNAAQKRRLYELAIFRAIQDKIGYTLNLDHIVDTIASSLKDLFSKSVALSMLVNEDKVIIKYYIEDRISSKYLEELKRRTIASWETYTGSFQSKPIEETRFGIVINTSERMFVESFFHIPVVVNEKLLGIITVSSQKQKAYLLEDIEAAYQITKQMCTALSKLEEVIQTEEGKLIGMIESLTDGIFMVDKSFNLTTINPAAKKILGINDDNPTIYQVLSPLSKTTDFKTEITDSMKNNKVFEQSEIQINEKTVQVAITPVILGAKQNFSQQVIGASVRLHDVTSEKAMAQLKEDFTSSIVHELRAPLSAIKAGSELMLTENEKLDKQQQEKTLEIIHKQSDRMLHDINSLLDAAKIESGHFSIVQKADNVLFVLAESQQLFSPEAEKKHISIVLDVDPKMPLGYFDSSRIGQVVNNLISNALKFTPDGGSIILHARKFFQEQLPQSSTNPGIIISVSDTGIGIPKEKQNLLFNKFSQIQNPGYGQRAIGTGLGLYVSKGIVEAHGGKVSVESLPGHGTTISFTLPIAKANVQVTKMETETPLIPIQKRTFN